jgi:iron(III) transport system permease protein
MDASASAPASQALRTSSARRRRKKSSTGHKLAFIVLLAIFGYLVVPPVLLMLWTSVTPGGEIGDVQNVTLSPYLEVLTQPQFWDLAANTLIFALGGTLGAMIIGVSMSWLVARTDVVGKPLAYAVAFLGFAVPGMLKVIGWILLLGPQNGAINNILRDVFGAWAILDIQSMGGMIFVESLLWTPMVFLLTLGPFRAMDPSLEESAAVSGASALRTYARVTAPLLMPSILSVLVLMFIKGVQAFEVPLFLGTPAGVRVFTSEIYLELRSSFLPDYSEAAAYGTLLVVVLMGVLIFYNHVTSKANRFQTVTGKGYRPKILKLGRARYLASAWLLLLFIITCLPIVYIFFASFLPRIGTLDGGILDALTLQNYTQLGNYPDIGRSLINSLIVGTVTATAVVILAGAASWLLVRSRIPAKWSLDQLIALPLIIPGIVLGLAVLLFYLHTPIPLYGTLWIMVVAYIASYTTYGIRYTQPALLQVHSELEESAKISGARWPTVFRRILLPLLMPAVLGAWVYVFFHGFRELSLAALLYTADTPVVSTQLLDLWVNGNLTVLSAFGAIVTIISVLVASIVFMVGSKFGVKS